ncbi:serine/threonine-protein phosphatase 6 regulatory ankyrin repeat subunit B-like protein [Cinnamomum micranthum f. kanehirae]|uniref:Serine/threonine-protein phosphatase 6 regulatory ankyrin repeat subunit B-like protein n=1 Tax=Cinnamomum micranthum f. kanehirae TaxID=337451 RepID=A0A3S3PZ72_9MAGN|nr:serine/threonine-protein phosphatase 6 regulatory ankyrin repeat subunit B-like protein [Cinnamomum micranthum f. kanehirae]
MSSNPSPPPPPPTTTTSQSDSKTQISHEISLENPPPTTLQVIDQLFQETKDELFQKTKDELFQKVMQEDWDAVVSIYEEKGDIVSTAKITRHKETALHIAISDSKTEVVKKLLDIIHPAIKIREMMNDMDENPLHLAASLGQAETCKQLVEKDPELIGARNKEGETPLFKAALHGKERAFYALHPKCPITGKDIKHDTVHCKRTDGNSILHVAIEGEYFSRWARTWEDIKHDICKIFNKDVEMQLPVRSTGKDKKQAPEDPSQDNIAKDSSKHCEHSHIKIEVGDEIKKKGEGSQEKEKDSTKQPQYPSNYNVFFYFVEFVMEFFLFVLGLGYFQVHKIKVKKQKHKLACQIMKKLVHNSNFWAYMDSGSAPVTIDSSIVKDYFLTEPPIEAPKHSTEGETHDGVSHIPPQQACGRPKGSELEKVKEMEETKGKSKDKGSINLSLSPGKEVLLEAEKTRPDVYRLKMLENDSQDQDGDHRNRSPVLIAVKMGVKEMVEEILNKFPVAIRDEDADKKNVVLLAVENRHPKIYKLLLKKYHKSHESVFQKVDKNRNSAIHLAATIGKNQFWRIPGAALQMQWELKCT